VKVPNYPLRAYKLFCLIYWQRCILLIFKSMQSKKHSWSAGLNFVDLGSRSVFLLYKLICKDNNNHVQSFNDQWVSVKKLKYPHLLTFPSRDFPLRVKCNDDDTIGDLNKLVADRPVPELRRSRSKSGLFRSIVASHVKTFVVIHFCC
jgi:hypothetical protein